MIREKPTIPTESEQHDGLEPVHASTPLATQEQMDNLAELLDAYYKENGPIPDEIRQQVYADLAAADAKIGYVR